MEVCRWQLWSLVTLIVFRLLTDHMERNSFEIVRTAFPKHVILAEGNNMSAWEVIRDSDSRLRRGWVKGKWKQLEVCAPYAVHSNMPFSMWARRLCVREDAAGEECRHGCKVGVKTAMFADLHADLPTPHGLVADSDLSVFMRVWEKAKTKKKAGNF